MKKKIGVSLLFLFLGLIAVFFIQRWRWAEDQGRHCVASDGRGYYAYLPAVFIYHDLHFNFLFETEKKTEGAAFIGDILVPAGEKKADKYFAGVSFLLSPFFIAALETARATGLEADGYSPIFQLTVCAGALFYFLFGLFCMRKLLLLYGVSGRNASIVTLFIGLGTNLFYYTVMEPSMSHVYSFAMISWFGFSVKKYFSGYRIKDILQSAFALACIILIRPSNVMIIMALPLLAGDFTILKTGVLKILRSRMVLFISALIVLAIVSIQPLLWFAETGKYFVWSYPGEGFNFSSPEIINVLFSYKKGLFVYSPMIFLSVIGSVGFLRINKTGFYAFIFFFALVTYVLSSWWNWYYGGSFGLRAFIDFYGIFAIPLAVCFHVIRNSVIRFFMFLTCSVFVWVNLVQSYQYSFNILHWDSMNKERYWEVFMKTQKRYAGYFSKEIILLDSTTVKNKIVFSTDFEGKEDWGNPNTITSSKAFSGTHSTTANEKMWFTAGFTKRLAEITKEKNVVLHVSCMANLDRLSSDAQLVVSYENRGRSYNWSSLMMNEYIEKKNNWEQLFYEARMPAVQSEDDTIKIYVMNTKHQVFADDFKIEFFELK